MRHPLDTGVLPEEYECRAILISHTRRLAVHQQHDLRIMVSLVNQRGWVSRAELYYLDIVGVPCYPDMKDPYGWTKKVKAGPKEQGRLF